MTNKARETQRGRARGYTVIEVMIAIAILAIGSSGIIALQKVTSTGNMRAKQLSVGSQIARTWIERLRTDAVTWNYPSPSRTTATDLTNDTLWLGQLGLGKANQWFRPAEVPGRGSAGFDGLGNDVPDAQWAQLAQYCTHLRLSWMYPNEIIRAEVRVFWLREGGLGALGNGVCDPAVAPTIFDTPANAALARYHAVYLTSSIVKNTAP